MPSWSAEIIADTVTPKLAAFAGKIERQVEAELDVVGADMEELAKELVHVKTGYLRSTIYHRVAGFQMDFGADADYASCVELGTRFMGPFPFMRPALDAYSQRILEAVLHGALNALGI